MPSVTVPKQEEYEVERILASRVVDSGGKKKVQYLIKWAHFPDSDNSWELEENFKYCDRLIQEFKLKNVAKKSGLEISAPDGEGSSSSSAEGNNHPNEQISGVSTVHAPVVAVEQTELENLRNELLLKNQEIEKLRTEKTQVGISLTEASGSLPDVSQRQCTKTEELQNLLTAKDREIDALRTEKGLIESQAKLIIVYRETQDNNIKIIQEKSAQISSLEDQLRKVENECETLKKEKHDADQRLSLTSVQVSTGKIKLDEALMGLKSLQENCEKASAAIKKDVEFVFDALGKNAVNDASGSQDEEFRSVSPTIKVVSVPLPSGSSSISESDQIAPKAGPVPPLKSAEIPACDQNSSHISFASTGNDTSSESNFSVPKAARSSLNNLPTRTSTRPKKRVEKYDQEFETALLQSKRMKQAESSSPKKDDEPARSSIRLSSLERALIARDKKKRESEKLYRLNPSLTKNRTG